MQTIQSMKGLAVDHEPDPPIYPEPHEWLDEPDAATKRAIDEAMEDLAAGRSVVCRSDEAFDGLLAELAADPKAS